MYIVCIIHTCIIFAAVFNICQTHRLKHHTDCYFSNQPSLYYILKNTFLPVSLYYKYSFAAVKCVYEQRKYKPNSLLRKTLQSSGSLFL